MALNGGITGDRLAQRRCLDLSIPDSDALFFPGPGGKVNKARAFCASCPAQSLCLEEAIKRDLQGFFAGTTREERDEMAIFLGDLEIVKIAVTVDTFVEVSVRRKAYRKVKPSEDPYSYLDEIEPLEAELAG